MNSAQANAAAAGAAVGASVTMILIFSLVIWIMLIIARWKVFTKAGEAGWKSIIPIYADYVQWRIGWKKTGLFWAMIGCAIVGAILPYVDGSVVVSAAGRAVAGANVGILGIIGIVLILVSFVLSLVAMYKLFKSFDKGIGWFIGYIFIAPIMLLVLGFGSSEYQGPQD